MPKYRLHEMPDMNNEGKRKVYPKLDRYQLIENEEFLNILYSYQRAIDRGVLEAVTMSMAKVLMLELSQGYNVKIDGVGTFSLSIAFDDGKTAELEDDGDEMKYRRVEVSNVNFKADPRLLKELKARTKFERQCSGVKVIKKSRYTLEQRMARALEVIGRDGKITLSGYAGINSMSRSAASAELKKICADPSSPIAELGCGTHKVWGKR